MSAIINILSNTISNHLPSLTYYINYHDFEQQLNVFHLPLYSNYFKTIRIDCLNKD